MKPSIIQEIIKPVKSRRLFSVTFKYQSKSILVGYFPEVKQAHQAFERFVNSYWGENTGLEVIMDLRFDHFNFDKSK